VGLGSHVIGSVWWEYRERSWSRICSRVGLIQLTGMVGKTASLIGFVIRFVVVAVSHYMDSSSFLVGVVQFHQWVEVIQVSFKLREEYVVLGIR